jgi:hypothetical protein
MISPRAARLVASIHKWLGLIVGLQLIVWTGTGLFFTSFAMTRIHGDHLVHPPAHTAAMDARELKLSSADALKRVYEDRPHEVILRTLADEPVYEIRADIGVFLVSAMTGDILSPISEETARKIALGRWAGPGQLERMELLDEAPRESSVQGGKVWVAHFSGEGHPVLYVQAVNGAVSEPRTDLWRTYDFLWSLHIMDWGPARENFNTPWAVALAVFALSTVLFGIVLLVHRFTRGVLRPKENA